MLPSPRESCAGRNLHHLHVAAFRQGIGPACHGQGFIQQEHKRRIVQVMYQGLLL